jgi:hypothetical protein
MNRREFLFSGPAAVASVSGAAAASRQILRREDCFFGLHFDLHPQKTDTVLGRDVTDAMVDNLLEQANPDYVQYDCKGHVGYMGYPSKVSTPSPGIVKDSLEIWRRATARRGVGLYIHFSGVIDALAVEQHPDWARVGPDGGKDPRQTSVFGPYVDERMLPQLQEAAQKYDLQGAWVDGECWGTKPDYSPAAAAAFTRATGIRQLPKADGDPGWQEFLDLNRQAFRDYVRHWVEALHTFRPGIQVASNWLYSMCVPEKPELPVDYVSGDIYGNAVLPSMGRLYSRYFAASGKPWDLMLWGWWRSPAGMMGPMHKPAVQLKQESLPVLSQGGGFQMYFTPTRAGKIDDHVVRTLAEVSAFCRERQAVCHKTGTVPQIGVLFSKNTLYTRTGQLFGGWGKASDPAAGMVDALVESHYSVDLIPDWKLAQVAAEYPLIVVPDWSNIGSDVRDILAGRVRQGGSVLVSGAENAALFSGELGVRLLGAPARQAAFILGTNILGNAGGLWQDVEPAGAEALEQRYPSHDSTRDGKCAATLNRLGSGSIAAIYGPTGADYAATHSAALRQFIRRIVARMFTPMVEIQGPPTIEVALRRKQGRLLVHLSNCTAMQVGADYPVIDYMPPVGPIQVSLRLDRPPRRATLEPGGTPVAGVVRDGVWRASIERLDLHSVLAVE